MALRSLSTASLRKEIARREKGAAKFIRKHAKMSKVLASLERTLADLGVGVGAMTGPRRGRPPGSKNKRRGRPPGSKNKKRGRKAKAGRKSGRKLPQNKFNLGDALASAVRPGAVVSPAEAMKKVKAAGYKSISKTLGIQVATRLAKDKRFKKKGRGQYLRVAA